MVSRSTRIKIFLIVMAMLVLLVPFLYQTCQIGKEQLRTSVTSPMWVVGPEGGVLTTKVTIENNAGCDANIESLEFRMYKLIYADNTTEEVDMQDKQVIHTTIPAGGNATINFAFGQPFRVGPRIIMVKITVVLQDGSSLEVFDGPIDTTAG